MTPLPASTIHLVQERAGNRCEYCRMHQSLQGATFHVEHVQPQSKGGSSTPENLAWCCPSCNLHKSDRISAMDPEGHNSVPLFNPRSEDWAVHFEWKDYHIAGKTPIGRATVVALQMNTARRILIR